MKFRAETSIKDTTWSIGGGVFDRKNIEDFMKIYLSKDFTFEGLL